MEEEIITLLALQGTLFPVTDYSTFDDLWHHLILRKFVGEHSSTNKFLFYEAYQDIHIYAKEINLYTLKEKSLFVKDDLRRAFYIRKARSKF